MFKFELYSSTLTLLQIQVELTPCPSQVLLVGNTVDFLEVLKGNLVSEVRFNFETEELRDPPLLDLRFCNKGFFCWVSLILSSSHVLSFKMREMLPCSMSGQESSK